MHLQAVASAFLIALLCQQDILVSAQLLSGVSVLGNLGSQKVVPAKVNGLENLGLENPGQANVNVQPKELSSDDLNQVVPVIAQSLAQQTGSTQPTDAQLEQAKEVAKAIHCVKYVLTVTSQTGSITTEELIAKLSAISQLSPDVVKQIDRCDKNAVAVISQFPSGVLNQVVSALGNLLGTVGNAVAGQREVVVNALGNGVARQKELLSGVGNLLV